MITYLVSFLLSSLMLNSFIVALFVKFSEWVGVGIDVTANSAQLSWSFVNILSVEPENILNTFLTFP